MTAQTPHSSEEIKFLGDLARLEVKPGDRFVLMIPGHLSMEQADYLRDAWRRFVGGDREDMQLLVLDDGIKIGVIGKEAA